MSIDSKKEESKPQEQGFEKHLSPTHKQKAQQFKTILTALKSEISGLTVEQAIKVFTDAKAKGGYARQDMYKWINPQPTEDQTKFSKKFQDLCKQNKVYTTDQYAKRKDLGLSTKRFHEMFDGKDDNAKELNMKAFINEVWSK